MSADIIFHKFLEFHSTLTEKKDFCHEFSLAFNRLTQKTLHPLLKWPKSAKHDKSFLLMPP